MDDARYGDLDQCTDCGASLTAQDTWLCAACITTRDATAQAEQILWEQDPDAFGALRDWQMTHQAPDVTERRQTAGVLLLATLAAGLVVSVGLRDLSARAPTLRALVPFADLALVYPAIARDPASGACAIHRAYADKTADAFCAQTRQAYRWDASHRRWVATSTTR